MSVVTDDLRIRTYWKIHELLEEGEDDQKVMNFVRDGVLAPGCEIVPELTHEIAFVKNQEDHGVPRWYLCVSSEVNGHRLLSGHRQQVRNHFLKWLGVNPTDIRK